AARCGVADLRDEDRHERRNAPAPAVRCAPGLRRAPALFPRGDCRSGGDRRRPGRAGARSRTGSPPGAPCACRGPPPRSGPDSTLSVPVRGDPSGDAAVAAVRHLRSSTVPAAFANTDAQVLVGGTTSENIDYFDSVIGPAPWVIAFVLGLTLVFLTVVFRSLVVAATAVVLNLLSVGSAYRMLVLVFQHGVAAGLFGFDQVD